jgi:predicted amidophosphoribosyltransferase
MADEFCLDCMTWHELPRCSHNPESTCPRCGHAFGYLAGQQVDRSVCWRCGEEMHPESMQ